MPFEKSQYDKEAKYPRYSLYESKLFTINSIARLTTELCERAPNFEYDGKRSRYKPEPYNFSTGHIYKNRIEEWQNDLAKHVVDSDYILILLNKTETAQLLETKNNKFADKTLLKEIMDILQKETEEYNKTVIANESASGGE